MAKVGERESERERDRDREIPTPDESIDYFPSVGESGRDGGRAGAASFVSVHENSSQPMLRVCEFHN